MHNNTLDGTLPSLGYTVEALYVLVVAGDASFMSWHKQASREQSTAATYSNRAALQRA